MFRTQITRATILGGCVALNVALPVQAELVAAVLPSSRSTEVGNTVTVFSTVINAGSETATGCSIESLSGLPITLGYQTTDPATNLPTGTANTPVDIPAGQPQSFVLSLTPAALVDSAQVAFRFSCTSGATAGTITGVNTLLLSASNTPVVDVIALAATSENTGVLSLNNSIGAFALATINIGAADTVTVIADTGDTSLPVVLSLCETNSATGACLEAPATSVDVAMPTGATPTFSVFSQASAAVDDNPAINRVFVRFTDSNAVVRGGTSVALANELFAGSPQFSQSTLSVLSRVFALAFGSTQTQPSGVGGISGGVAVRNVAPEVIVPIEQTILCETGQIEVTGSSDEDQNGGTSSVMMDFQNCDGISGMLTVVTNIAFDGATVAFDATQNGSFTAEGCEEITMTGVRISGEFNVAQPIDDVLAGNAFTTSGVISGRCEGEAFSCSLDEVDVQDETAFVTNCSG